jgi:hypothetical protein
MAGEFEVRPEMLKEISQALMQMKANTRSVEGSAEALIPLAQGNTLALIQGIAMKAGECERDIQAVYLSIAKQAANV